MNNARPNCYFVPNKLNGGQPNFIDRLGKTVVKDMDPTKTKSLTISGLRLGSTYYVRMRTYWLKGNQRMFSTCPPWSKPINIPCPDNANCMDEAVR